MTGPVNRTVVRLGLRSLFGRRRGVLLFVLPVVPVALSVLVRALAGSTTDSAHGVLYTLGLAVVVPLVALIAITGLLVPELDDGSVAYLLAKPLSRHVIVASKLLVALSCVLLFAAVPLLVSGLVLKTDEPRLALGYAVGGAAGGAAYCAVFALVSVLTRHAVIVGLIYVLIWEGLLGGLLDGIRWVSITRWSAAIADSISRRVEGVGELSASYAVVATVVVVLVATWLTGRRLRGFNLTGDE
jgi:ABC-2 type transport system permease protein